MLVVLIIGVSTSVILAQVEPLSKIKIAVNFSSAPQSYNIVIPVLKYDKTSALVLQMDNGTDDIYQNILPFFSNKFFTDGAGNDIPYRMGVNNFVMKNGKDVHKDGSGYLTWGQIGELWRAKYSIVSNGFDNPTISYMQNYEVERSVSYTKRMTKDVYPGGINMDSYFLPANGENQTIPARKNGFISIFGSTGLSGLPNPVKIDEVSYPYNTHFFTQNIISDVLFQQVQQYISGSNNFAHWVGFYHTGKFGISPNISLETFKQQINAISLAYGKSGKDNLWVTGPQEFFEYQVLRKLISYSDIALGNSVSISLSGTDIPTHFQNYELTLIIVGDQPVKSVDITGASLSTYIVSGDSAFINLVWKGQKIDSAEIVAQKFIQIAKANPTDSVASLIASDYVSTILNPDSLKKYTDLLCTSPNPSLKEFCSYHFKVNDTSICHGDTATLFAPFGMKKYKWSTGDTTRIISVSPSQNTTYTVTVTTTNGQTGSSSAFVVVNPLPVFSHSPDTVVTPPGKDTLLWVSSGYNYLWSNGSVDTSIRIVNPVKTEAYWVKVSAVNGCSVKQNFYVVPDYQYHIDFTYDTVCFGDSTTLINRSSARDSVISVSWDLNMDGKYNDGYGDTVIYKFPVAKIYPVAMKIIYKSGSVFVKIHQVPVGSIPKVNFTYSGICAPNTTTRFVDSSSVQVGEISQQYWNFGDGKTEYRTNQYAYHNYYPGIYDVTLRITSNYGCYDSLTKKVTIYNQPSIVLLKADGKQVYFDDTVSFARGDSAFLKVQNPTTYDSIIWPGHIVAPDYYLKQTGLFRVIGYRNICAGYAEFIGMYTIGGAVPGGGGAVSVPVMSVFTPNGDGYNDKWVVKSPEISNPIEVWIYNRAGSLVYHASVYNNDWNGDYNGNPLPQDTYYYLIKDAAGKKFVGYITLIR